MNVAVLDQTLTHTHKKKLFWFSYNRYLPFIFSIEISKDSTKPVLVKYYKNQKGKMTEQYKNIKL